MQEKEEKLWNMGREREAIPSLSLHKEWMRQTFCKSHNLEYLGSIVLSFPQVEWNNHGPIFKIGIVSIIRYFLSFTNCLGTEVIISEKQYTTAPAPQEKKLQEFYL